MDALTINKLAEKISARAYQYNTQKAYSIGNNTAILTPVPKASPDNRKPVPFARRAVAMIKGYMSKPGNITYSGEYAEVLKPVFDFNDEELTTANELEDALIHGVCYELHWLEDGVKNFYPIPVIQGMPIYDNSLRPKLIGFIWIRKIDGKDIATYYDDKIYQEWIKTDENKGSKSEWTAGPELPHGYGVVPVNIGAIDRDSRNLFDHVLPLIDLFDKLISEDVGNELERFNAAILAMAERIDSTTVDASGKTMIDRLKELRLIDGLDPSGAGDVKNKIAFITRDIPTEFIKFAAGQVERLIYEMLMIVNPNDDNFATASGVAQSYKLLGMEYLCASIEAYFSKFLQNRIKIIAGISDNLLEDSSGSSNVTIKFQRNLPHNLTEIADVMAKMNGLVSDETLLRLLPTSIVPDINAEIEAMEKDEPEMSVISSDDENLDI